MRERTTGALVIACLATAGVTFGAVFNGAGPLLTNLIAFVTSIISGFGAYALLANGKRDESESARL
jgi:hypothetical protein